MYPDISNMNTTLMVTDWANDVATKQASSGFVDLKTLQHLSYSERLQLLKIDSFECRRLKADLIMFFKIVHQLIDLEVHTFFDISNSNTRGHNFKIKRFRVNSNENEFSNRSVNVWNSLPDAVVYSNDNEFSNRSVNVWNSLPDAVVNSNDNEFSNRSVNVWNSLPDAVVNSNDNDFSNRSVNVWNSLPDAVVNCNSLSLFKYKLKSCSIDKYRARIRLIFAMYLLYRLFYLSCFSFFCRL